MAMNWKHKRYPVVATVDGIDDAQYVIYLSLGKFDVVLRRYDARRKRQTVIWQSNGWPLVDDAKGAAERHESARIARKALTDPTT